jgi:hypothetical protein
MLSFLIDRPSGMSSARQEASVFRQRHPTDFVHLLAHLVAVDKSIAADRHDSKAIREATVYLSHSGKPDLYWWEYRRLGAFYIIDGSNVIVVLIGLVGNPPTFQTLWTTALARI